MNKFILFMNLVLAGYFLIGPAVFAQDPDGECLPGMKCSGEGERCLPGQECSKDKKPKITIPDQLITVTTSFQDGAVALEPTKTVIDVSRFESSGSMDHVEDVLKHLTGIDVIQGSGGVDPQQVIMLRGFDDSRFQVAINGRPVTGPTAGSDTFVDWSSLTMGDIDKIEVIRGSASARFENSTGGIINIISKKGQKGDTLIPRVSATTSYSSFNTLNTRGTMSGGAGDLGYFINFGNRRSDGFLRNNYYDGIDYSGRLDYDAPWKGGFFTVSFKRSELEHGYPVVNDPDCDIAGCDYDSDYPLVTEDADTIRLSRYMSYPGGDNNKIKKASHFDVSYDQSIGYTNLSIHYFLDRGSEDSYWYQRSGDSLVQKFSGHGDRKEKTFGVMVDYSMNFWTRHSLAIGYSQRRMEVHNTPDIYRIQGAYIEDQYAVTDKLILNLGLRYMNVRELSYAYADPGTTETYRHKIITKLFLPKFTATYIFNPETEVFVSVNRDYHFPGC